MQVHIGRIVAGPAGSATEVIIDEVDRPDVQATVGSWFIHAPGQSPAWEHYALSVCHLRDVPGQTHPAHILIEGATHELLLIALDPKHDPTPLDPLSWHMLTPVNASEQFRVPSDENAADLLAFAAEAVANGRLPAEPALSGAKEPWHTVVEVTAQHFWGEHGELIG